MRIEITKSGLEEKNTNENRIMKMLVARYGEQAVLDRAATTMFTTIHSVKTPYGELIRVYSTRNGFSNYWWLDR